MAVTTLAPASVKVASEYNYLNSLALAEGLHKPEVSSVYVQRYGRQDITGLLEMLGNKKAVNNPKFSHYEQERIHGKFNLHATAAAGTGTGEFGFTISTGTSQYTYSGQSPYPTADSFTVNPLSVNDVIEVKGYTMYVTAVNGSAFSAINSDASTANGHPAIATTDDIIIKGSASPEGSGAPDSRNSRVISYSNYLQIMRRTHKVTGTEFGTKTWIEVEGKNGQKGYFWYLQGVADEYHRFLNEREATLLTGDDFQSNLAGLAGAGSASFGDANSVTFTKGLIPQISADGNVEGYGTLTITDIEDMTKELQKNRGARESMLACGHDFKLDVDALIYNGGGSFLGSSGVQFAAFQGVENQDIRFSIDGIEFGGYKFALKVLDMFSDPNLLGYAGGAYSKMGMVIPMDDTVVYNNMNSSTGVLVPSLTLNYLDNDEGGRDYMEWVTGKGMGAATSGDDFFEVHMLSHCGLEVSALNRFGLFTYVAP